MDRKPKPSLLERIALRNQSLTKTAKYALDKIALFVAPVLNWRAAISGLLRFQMVAMLHIIVTMQANNTVKRGQTEAEQEDARDVRAVQQQILKDIIDDVAAKLTRAGDKIDEVVAELDPVATASILLNQAVQNQTMVNDAEIRALVTGDDFTGLVDYLEAHEAMSIVAALMQTRPSKAVTVAALLRDAAEIGE
jgi:large-conductance mechanosensitive channel